MNKTQQVGILDVNKETCKVIMLLNRAVLAPIETVDWHNKVIPSIHDSMHFIQDYCDTILEEDKHNVTEETWTHFAYARLGYLRDKMRPEDVKTIQDFLNA